MTSYPISLVLMGGVIVAALSGSDWRIFMNTHSVILVLGGTVAVLGLATPWKVVGQLLTALAGMARRERSEFLSETDLRKLDENKLARTSSTNPLVAYAQSLWEGGVDTEVFVVLLHQSRDKMNQESAQPVATMRNLAKYPPAFGMIGTVVGLVSLFSNLSPDNHGSLGPSLALAMTATFYGLILSNAVLMPLADRLYVIHLRQTKINDQLFDILLLLHRGDSPQLMEDSARAA